MKILATDVGGTHARVATFRTGAGRRPEKLRERTWPSSEHDGLLPILEAFLREEEELPERASLGLAGPIDDGVCHLPNLGWTVRRDEVARGTGIADLELLNDFDAVGHGISLLTGDELAVLHEGDADPEAPIAVLGPGTGLGVAYVDPSHSPPRVHSSEGGHADFAPRTDEEWKLARHLADRYDRVSWERVLSGGGLTDIHDFLATAGPAAAVREIRREMTEGDPAAVVARHGLAGDDPLARKALEMFVSALGALAGNLALTFGARGGVYLAGGIPHRILEAFSWGPFLTSFLAKGRMESYLEPVPVRVVLSEDVGLLGAAAVAAEGGAAGRRASQV